jgi:hypothetical protein
MLKRLRNLLSPPAVQGTSAGKRRCDPPATEQRAALFDGRHITYILKRSSRRRSIGLRIDGRGLTVSVPHRTPEGLLRDVLKEKAAWVVEKLDGWQARKAQEICWADGESVPYLGELLTLRVVQTAPPVQQHSDELRIYLRGEVNPARIEQRVTKWYRQQALSLFTARVAHYAPQLGVAPLIVKLSTAKTQWGSCTRCGTVRLNLQLIKLPLHLIDYVVVHELAHLCEMNHSDAFWRVVASACPDYAKLRRELKTVGL